MGSLRKRKLGAGLTLLAAASCMPLAATDLSDMPSLKKAAPSAETTSPRSPPLPPAGPVDAAMGDPMSAALLPDPMLLRELSPTGAAALNAAIPMFSGPNPAASASVFRGLSATDRHRALQCLAEAVFYEARSESEEGQRAVAQVVLNRVRSPAYPASVCGVVYQGPMRAGGGCQFTFTCDGSLALAPFGASWLRAQRIAAAALAGEVFAPAGLATHYHTQQVLPTWAYKLAKSTVIGSHSFYRMQGGWGSPRGFGRAYSGHEPSPVSIIASRLPISLGRAARTAFAALAPGASGAPVSWTMVAANSAPPAPPPVNDRLPQSRVRAEFASSGAVRDETAPAAW